MSSSKPVIGIIGAGKLGTTLARLAIKAGYQVYIAGSGDSEKIALSIKVITQGAMAATTDEVSNKAEIIILALPFSKVQDIPVKLLKDRLVIDATNYWWEVDGDMPQLRSAASSSEMVRELLGRPRLVKALSHMGYHNLFDGARPKDAADRKAIAVAGDNLEDNKLVSKLVDELGFDPFVIGSLNNGKLLEPGQPLFGANLSLNEMRKIIK